MIRLILMRHGNTFDVGEVPLQVGARTDLPLTTFGRGQAKAMVAYLNRERIIPAAIFAGSLKRQTESAEIIGSSFGLKFEHTPALTELDYGLWEGLSSHEIGAKWPNEYREWNEEAKWQPSIFRGTQEEHRNNLDSWFNELKKKYEGKTLIAITSNGLLRLFKNEKVKTGHFSEIVLLEEGIKICGWNQNTI